MTATRGPDLMSFIRNAWYPAAWSADVATKPLARTFLGEEVILYRASAGQPVALANACPHRFAALAKGKLHGDSIACPYHGLQFGTDGSCTHNPHGPATGAMRVRCYPLCERNGMIWIWMGDPTRADEANVMALSATEDPELDWISGYLHVEGNYQLVIDNLLDLTHVEFMHPFLADPTDTFPTDVACFEEGEDIVSRYTREQSNTSQLVSALWPDAPSVTSLLSEIRWRAPANLELLNYFSLAGAATSPDPRVRIPFFHLLTPETTTTTHYFWSAGRNLKRGDVQTAAALRAGIESTFVEEDEPMIADIQRRIGDRALLDMKPLLLSIDKSAILARRRVEALLQAERETSTG